MAITFDITFIPGASAIGAFLEYRPVHPSGPSGPSQYPWVTNVNTPNSNVIGYFPITGSPMFLDDVPGVAPDFQENAVYEFRIKQLCADGTELYSDVDGDYWIPNCDRFTSGINVNIPIQQGPFGVDVTFGYRPGSSISNYIIDLLNPAGTLLGTTNVSYTQMDTSGNTNFVYTFTNDNLIAPNVFQTNVNYIVRVTIVLQTNNGPIQVANCSTFTVKAIGCTSWDIEFGDNWGLRWYDCEGGYHECFSNSPYTTEFPPEVLRICSPGSPEAFYCSGNTFTNGFVVDPVTNLVTLGGRITLVAPENCLPGYSDFDTGELLYANGVIVPCVTSGPCFGGNNIIIVTRCMPTTNLGVTTYRNGDPIPYVDDPLLWNTLTTGAWCWPQFNPANAAFGKLYNYYAASDPRNIAPVGYHVPTYNEWFSFIFDLTFQAGYTPKDLRIVDSTYWNNNTGATDFFGFSAKGSGNTEAAGSVTFKRTAAFWTILDPLVNPSYYFINTEPAQNYGWRNNIGDPNYFKSIGCGIRLFCGD